jgi:hypothetical protein
VEVRCTNPVANVLAAQARLTIKAVELRAVSNFFQSDVIAVKLRGPVSITGAGYSVVGNWTLAQTDLDGPASHVDRTSIVLEGFKFNRMTESVSETIFSGDRMTLDIHFNRTSDPGQNDVDLALRVDQGSGPLGPQPFNAEIAAVLRGVGDAKPRPWLAQLKEWESIDGRLVVKHATIRRHDDAVVAQGTLGLDGRGRITGRLRATTTATTFERFAEALLGDNGRMKVAQALARAANVNPLPEEERRRQLAQAEQEGRELRSLGIAPLPSPNAARGEITMPLTFMNGAIFIGSVLVGQVPPLY